MTLPKDMRVIEITQPGGPDVLTEGTRSMPILGEDEVLIKVVAAGVNRGDCLQRAGAYPAPPGASDLLGLEAAGEVVAVGDSVTRWSVGDQVCALLPGGGYAEYAVTDQHQALRIPNGLSMVEAVSLPETLFTVWTNVFDRGALQAGETFLVHGGSSGIGTMAIQLAKAFGARVFTTVGNEEKAQVCRDLGADMVVNYREADFVEVLKQATGGEGVNLTLDMVGGPYFQKNIDLAADQGRIHNIAFLQGADAKVNFTQVMSKRLTLSGSTLRPRTTEEKAAIAKNLEEKVWPLVEAGQVRPVVAATFPLSDAIKAHELMESSAHIGKIVLEV